MQRCVDTSLLPDRESLRPQVTAIDTGAERHTLSFDVIAETLRATNLGRLREGSTVNFERRGPPLVLVSLLRAVWHTSRLECDCA